MNHVSAPGCYYFDPEGNRTEVFWLTGRPSWVMVAMPIDIQRPLEEVLADVDALHDKTRHVAMGEVPDAVAVAAMREAVEAAREKLAAARV